MFSREKRGALLVIVFLIMRFVLINSLFNMCIPLSGIIVLQRPLSGNKDTAEDGVKMFDVEEATLAPQL